MKVEIDINELTKLKNELSHLAQENAQLKHKLNSLSETVIADKIQTEAFAVANLYLGTIFNKLGIKGKPKADVIVLPRIAPPNFEIEKFYQHENQIEIKIGAEILGGFKDAFLQVGIITEIEKED